MEVLVFGSAIVDFICYVERLPKAGETLHGHKFATGFGGKGANQCVAAARLGAKTAMIAKLGKDDWGTKYLRHLREEGVNTKYVDQCDNETTGIAQISVSDAGENNIVIVVGANNLLSSRDVSQASELFNIAKILICQLETPINATLAALHAFKGVSILNAAPALANTPVELIQAATIVCVNENEAALTTGCKKIETVKQSKEALEKLINMGANIAIITLGELGVTYVKGNDPKLYIHVPTPKVKQVKDTTGAGDAFIGSLAYFMAHYSEQPLHQHIGAACAIAAYSVERQGTQLSFPHASQVDIDLNKKQYEWNEI